MCSDYYLGLLELDLRSPSTSHVIQAGSSASDVLSLISRCSNGGYKPFVPTSMALNTTTDTTMQPTTVCEPSAIYTIQPGDTCKDLCLAHNVSTHSLTASNGLEAYCRDFPLAGTEICLPKSCNMYTVNINDTMQSIAEQQPGNFSIAQLLAWNPILIPLWKLIRQTHLQICVSPPMSALSVPNAANIIAAGTTRFGLATHAQTSRRRGASRCLISTP
jgi:LysM repeat protein